MIEDEPATIITESQPQTAPPPTPFVASNYTIYLPPVDPNPTLILNDTLLHPPIPYLASTPIVIPIQDKIRSKYTLAIDAISQMPSGTTLPIAHKSYIYATYEPITGKVHNNQTGAMPITSISGKSYLFVLYDEDSNYIGAIPIPTRTKHQMLKAYKPSHAILKSRGL